MDALEAEKGEWWEMMRHRFNPFARFSFSAIQPGVIFEPNWHIDCICEHLEAMLRGEIPRLIINLPPRSLKSFLVSQAFPAWVLGRDPSDKFINVSYGASVVEQNALNCRRIIEWPEYKNIFPTYHPGNIDRNMHFQTSQGGHYYADTALSAITGIGCNWMVVDDPIKPMEAMSDQVRRSTIENIRSTLFNRFDDKRIAKFLMVMQRVHEDDPSGNLLADGGFVHLKLPGETRKTISVALKTPYGERNWVMPENSLLFPERLDRKMLDQLRLDMTEYHYAGQILQEPVPLGGGEFKDTWVQYYQGGDVIPTKMNIVILVDAAGGEETNKKKKKTSDFTAMMVVGLGQDHNYYLLDIVRDRLNLTERGDTLFTLHRKWNQLTGKPPKVGYERYGLMADVIYIKEKQRREGYMFPVIELGGQLSKDDRIRRLIPDMEQGRWYFPANLIYVDNEGRRFDLIRELVYSEMMVFNRARFDDMLDALSRIKDTELNMVFPKLTVKIESNIVRQGEVERADSWKDF